MLSEILGAIAALMMLAAYYLSSAQIWRPHGESCSLLNLGGALCACLSLLDGYTSTELVMGFGWGSLSLYHLYKSHRRKGYLYSLDWVAGLRPK